MLPEMRIRTIGPFWRFCGVLVAEEDDVGIVVVADGVRLRMPAPAAEILRDASIRHPELVSL
jgi:hypothetical protein